MLDACAPRHTRKENLHHYCIRFNGKTYPSLPKGEHGRGLRAEIELGHVKKMIRHLGIDLDCAKKHLPGLA